MKVFITGGTGFVGTEIVREAHAAGHALRLLVRHPKSSGQHHLGSPHPIESHRGDLLDPASLEGALHGIDTVIHLVGIISEVGRSTFENIHTRATQTLLAATQRAGVKRFLHMSALGARLGAVSRYHQTKWQAEEAVRQSGLAFTIFRPSLIYGPQDHFVNLFARMARLSPVLPIFGSARARFRPVSVRVVADAFIRSVDQPASISQTYELCGPETFTFPELLDQILSATGRRRLKVHVPLVLARIQAAFLEILCPRLLGKAPPLNRDQLEMLQEDNLGHGTAANNLFHLKHQPFGREITLFLKRRT